jgi:hypothetical protein
LVGGKGASLGSLTHAGYFGAGWTPTFSVIKAAIIGTGDSLAGAARLTQENGSPAVPQSAAMHRNPDGDLVTVGGNSGVGTIEYESEEAAA